MGRVPLHRPRVWAGKDTTPLRGSQGERWSVGARRHVTAAPSPPLCVESPQVKALLRRATARDALQKYDGAEADLRAVLKIEPNNKQAREDLRVRVRVATVRCPRSALSTGWTGTERLDAPRRQFAQALRQHQAQMAEAQAAMVAQMRAQQQQGGEAAAAAAAAAAGLPPGIDPSMFPPGFLEQQLGPEELQQFEEYMAAAAAAGQGGANGLSL